MARSHPGWMRSIPRSRSSAMTRFSGILLSCPPFHWQRSSSTCTTFRGCPSPSSTSGTTCSWAGPSSPTTFTRWRAATSCTTLGTFRTAVPAVIAIIPSHAQVPTPSSATAPATLSATPGSASMTSATARTTRRSSCRRASLPPPNPRLPARNVAVRAVPSSGSATAPATASATWRSADLMHTTA